MRRSSRRSAAKANESLLSSTKDAGRKGAGEVAEQQGKAGASTSVEMVNDDGAAKEETKPVAKRKRTSAASAAPAAAGEDKDVSSEPVARPELKKGRKDKKSADEEPVPADDASAVVAMDENAHADGSQGDVELPDTASDYSDEAPVAKKSKKKGKKLTKKVVTWKELSKQSNVSFGQFPVEVMDLIVSVDSALDLRDHLALAATCRFFRACYTDLVWQTLFAAHLPDVVGPSSAMRVDYTVAYSRDMYGRDIKDDPLSLASYVYGPDRRGLKLYPQRHIGPFDNSWRFARRIFSRGIQYPDGSPGAARWGLTEAEWDAGAKERDKLAQETIEAVTADKNLKDRVTHLWAQRKVVMLPEVFEPALFRDFTPEEEQRYSYILTPEPTAKDAASPIPAYDPWPSAWRDLVAHCVNKPLLSKTDAKKLMKVTDRELLAIPHIKPSREDRYDVHASDFGMPLTGGYRLATLQALALRAHGGAAGHEEHVKKLAERAAKAHATRVRNGTIQQKKAPRFSGQGGIAGLDAYLSTLVPAQLELLLDWYEDEMMFDDMYDDYYSDGLYSDEYSLDDSEYGYDGDMEGWGW